MKKTVVLGASPNPSRYSYVAIQMLDEQGYEFIPLGIKKGCINRKEILDLRQKPKIHDIDTITIYMSAANQYQWHDYILSLNPKRVIFNPGAENPELADLANRQGIEVEFACSLMMLSVGNY